MQCFHYDLDFGGRLKKIGELGSPRANSRILHVQDTVTEIEYVLKVYPNDRKYTSELVGLGRLNGPYFPKPICTMAVRLPVRIMTPHDHSDYEDESMIGQQVALYKYVTRPAILMEYIKGGKTSNVYAYELGLEAGLNDPQKAKQAFEAISRVSAQAFHALTQAHQAGLILHDLKPENMIVREDGTLVMIDYDSSSDRAEPCKGSTPTTAPEQWGLIKGNLHHGVDWWAYGATVAILLSAVCAGMYHQRSPSLASLLSNYTPLRFDHQTLQYIMSPLPSILSPMNREFLYPFFVPDPDKRKFCTKGDIRMIQALEFFKSVDWSTIEEPAHIEGQFFGKSSEDIRAFFLSHARRNFDNIHSSINRRRPQMLYAKDEEMMATDLEASRLVDKLIYHPVPVKQLLNRKVRISRARN